jgi:hypothetical protein
MNSNPSKSISEATQHPPLAFSLWALRKQMADDPEATLQLLRRIGFESVELSGFFNRGAEELLVDIDSIVGLPIHSVHLGVRDDNGKCCALNQYPERCLEYAKAIISKRGAKRGDITWILENDSREDLEEVRHTESVITSCYADWPSFWQLINESQSQRNTKSPRKSTKTASEAPNQDKAQERTAKLCDLFAPEIEDATREHLLGESKSLFFFAKNDPRVDYYVTKRQLLKLSAFHFYWCPFALSAFT